MNENFDPAEALAMATDARQKLATRAASPWWYAPLYGLGCGAMIASFALPGGQAMIGVALSTLFVTALYAVWNAKTGLSVSGYRAGRTLPISLALMVALVGLLALAVRLKDGGYGWAPLACGAVAAVLAALASLAWDRVWRSEMTETL